MQLLSFFDLIDRPALAIKLTARRGPLSFVFLLYLLVSLFVKYLVEKYLPKVVLVPVM